MCGVGAACLMCPRTSWNRHSPAPWAVRSTARSTLAGGTTSRSRWSRGESAAFWTARRSTTWSFPETLGPSVYGAAGRTAGGEIVVRLVNCSPLKQNVSINLASGAPDRYSAVATHLTSNNLDDENSLAEPTRIAPIERELPSVGGTFQYELEANSFTVLRLKPEGR